MGIPLSKEHDKSQYMDLMLLTSENVDALGKFEVYEDKANSKSYLVFQSSYSISNVELTESSITQLKKIESIQNCCKLVSHTISKSNVLCFDNFSINLCFEHYSVSFASEIDKRVQGTQVNETEVWGFVEDLVVYLSDLKHYAIAHGDLQPKNILLNKNRVVKLLAPLLYTTFENAYKLKLANNAYKSTYSPEELSLFENRLSNANLDCHKCDIFSLGICLLSFIRGIPFEKFYNFSVNKIEMDMVKKEMAKILQESKLSEELFFFVNVCTKENPIDRADFELLSKIISKRKQKYKTEDQIYW